MQQAQHSALSAVEQAQILAFQRKLSVFQRALREKLSEQSQSSVEPKTAIIAALLRLAPLVFVRPGDLRCARWVDIDLEAAEWRFTAGKTGKAHIVPLAAQAVDILRGLHPLTGNREFAFPGTSQPERPMSEMAMRMALRKLGFSTAISIYDFRRMARAILSKALRFPSECIQLQMGHPVGGETERIYNTALCDPKHRLAERKTMMQAWADWLDGLREDGDVVAMAA